MSDQTPIVFDNRSIPITVEAVEREIAGGALRLKFAGPIEAAFEADTAEERVRMFFVSGLVAVGLYDLFLIHDWLAVPDVLPALLWARLGVFTPVLLLLIWFIFRNPRSVWRESAATFGAILGVLLPMSAMVFSESPHRLSYQLGTLLIMMFTAVVQRVRFRFAAVGLFAITAIQAVTTGLSSAFDGATYGANLIIFVTASLLLLMAAYFAELAERRSFLFALRGRLLQERLVRIAQTDPLTGLFNRRHLAEAGEAIWATSADAPRTVSAILLDIDQFKPFNDNYGHIEGDRCLRAVSAAVVGALQGSGSIAVRFGGEEVLVLMPGADAPEAARLAQAIQAAIRALAIPHPVLGEGAIVTASLGVATARAPETSLSELIATADRALYAAKRVGRGSIRHADDVAGLASPLLTAA